MFIKFRRLSVFVESTPFRWSELVSINQRSECRGRFVSWDAIIGSSRIVASWRR